MPHQSLRELADVALNMAEVEELVGELGRVPVPAVEAGRGRSKIEGVHRRIHERIDVGDVVQRLPLRIRLGLLGQFVGLDRRAIAQEGADILPTPWPDRNAVRSWPR